MLGTVSWSWKSSALNFCTILGSCLRQVLLWNLEWPSDSCVTPGWPRLAVLLTLSVIDEVTQCRIMPKNLELGTLCSLKIVLFKTDVKSHSK